MTSSATARPRGLVARSRGVFGELSKFGVVGFVSLLVDLAVFNLVLAVLPHKPLTAKVISTVVSATNAYVLNRHWSFRARERQHAIGRELTLFMLLNGVGLLLSLACLATSHYLLGLDSRLADNVAANGVGLVVGTAFRFWSYRRFVWVHPSGDGLPAGLEDEAPVDPLTAGGGVRPLPMAQPERRSA